MAMKQAFKSDAFASIHATAAALHEAVITDRATMRWSNDACLKAPPAIEPAQIKQLRESLNISQPVFARYLNTSESTIEKWETGAK